MRKQKNKNINKTTLLVDTTVLIDKSPPVLSFEAWWTLIQHKYNFPVYLKQVIYSHFKSKGFLDNKQFDEGLKDFGYNIKEQ